MNVMINFIAEYTHKHPRWYLELLMCLFNNGHWVAMLIFLLFTYNQL